MYYLYTIENDGNLFLEKMSGEQRLQSKTNFILIIIKNYKQHEAS